MRQATDRSSARNHDPDRRPQPPRLIGLRRSFFRVGADLLAGAKRLEISSQDEIGEAAKWFNTFMDKLQTVIISVGANTKGVANSSERMSAVSKTLMAN
jgi:methyl-accepting chemotaxis protein